MEDVGGVKMEAWWTTDAQFSSKDLVVKNKFVDVEYLQSAHGPLWHCNLSQLPGPHFEIAYVLQVLKYSHLIYLVSLKNLIELPVSKTLSFLNHVLRLNLLLVVLSAEHSSYAFFHHPYPQRAMKDLHSISAYLPSQKMQTVLWGNRIYRLE